jgi:hypothetical protein
VQKTGSFLNRSRPGHPEGFPAELGAEPQVGVDEIGNTNPAIKPGRAAYGRMETSPKYFDFDLYVAEVNQWQKDVAILIGASRR